MAAPQQPAPPQFEISRLLTNILESLFSFPRRKYDGLALPQGTHPPWLEVVVVEHVESCVANMVARTHESCSS